MSDAPPWWQRPRTVSVVVDNPSWVIPYAQRLVSELRAQGDDARFVRDHGDVAKGGVAFYLSCVRIAPPAVTQRNRRNLVVHASDLPKGRGFSPLTWQILEGQKRIPICLLDAADSVDAGPVVYRDWIEYAGHELSDELRDPIGQKSIELCRRFLAAPSPPEGIAQTGEPSVYPRRGPADSRLDPSRSIADQFELLRVVDNERYPAWFEYRGHRYKLAIEKIRE